MRQIGRLDDEASARRLMDALAVAQIESKLDQANDGWLVWVRDEDRLPAAREILQRFQADPNSQEFRQTEGATLRLKQERERREREAQRKVVKMGDRWQQPVARRAPITLLLVVLSFAVALATSFGNTDSLGSSEAPFSTRVMRALLFVDAPGYFAAHAEIDQTELDSFEFRTWSLRRGEIWRLFSPSLLHFGPIHLIFNMLMLFRVGSLLENFVGSARYVAFVITCGIVANVGCLMPEAIGGGWLSGGMSGVLYGLFGWALLLQRMHPSRPQFISPVTTFLLLAWLAFGFLGMLDGEGYRIGNWAHGAGFAFGLAIGYLHVMTIKRT